MSRRRSHRLQSFKFAECARPWLKLRRCRSDTKRNFGRNQIFQRRVNEPHAIADNVEEDIFCREKVGPAIAWNMRGGSVNLNVWDKWIFCLRAA
jgi:hypothetical protein